MRLLVLLVACVVLWADAPDEKAIVAVVQRTFDGMAAHDAGMIRSTMLADARLYAVRADGAAAASRSGEEFATQIAAAKGELLERFTARPQVLVHGRIAQVWAEYEFLRDGKFTHCGVDSASLLKTADGWKIASLSYTMETSGCKGR